MTEVDSVDGSSTGIQVPKCGCYTEPANVRYWLLADIPAYVVLCPLLGVKRTFLGVTYYVRFTPNSGHSTLEKLPLASHPSLNARGACYSDFSSKSPIHLLLDAWAAAFLRSDTKGARHGLGLIRFEVEPGKQLGLRAS